MIRLISTSQDQDYEVSIDPQSDYKRGGREAGTILLSFGILAPATDETQRGDQAPNELEAKMAGYGRPVGYMALLERCRSGLLRRDALATSRSGLSPSANPRTTGSIAVSSV